MRSENHNDGGGMRRRIYIAGPIAKGDLAGNVNRATTAFISLAKMGFAPMCPHLSVYSSPCVPGDNPNEVHAVGTPGGNHNMSQADWLGVDLPWVAASDAVLRIQGESVGAEQEVALAKELGIPVVYDLESVSALFPKNN